jgi:hypothetical protein
VSSQEPRRAELATVVRAWAHRYRERHGLSGGEDRVLRAIAACRTEDMGGQVRACNACGAAHYCYHSCRNRHCPKCQTRAKEAWLDRQRLQLLPVPYFHVVFTLPHALNGLIRCNARLLYGLLFDTAAKTLQSFAENPKWLGGQMGFTLVLHTWSQTLAHHSRVHGLVTGGALRAGTEWKSAKPGFLFPVQALSRVFRGKYLDAIEALRQDNALHMPIDLATDAACNALITTLRRQPWVVYLKPPLAGPEHVLQYLARYTHRIAISNERLVQVDDQDVVFRYRPPHGSVAHEKKSMRLSHDEFLRRFLLHVLPHGFKRIRHYGLTANRNKAVKLAACRAVLNAPTPPARVVESAEAFLLRVTDLDLNRCRHCKEGILIVIHHLPRPTRLPDLRATGPPHWS